MEGSTPWPLTYIFLRGLAFRAWDQCHTWLRTKSSLIKAVALRRARLPTDAGPCTSFSLDAVESCLQELKRAQFTVSADVVLTLAQCTEQLGFQFYDLVVAECPSPNWKGSQALQLLHQAAQETPLLFVTTAMGSESIVHPTADGAIDYVELEHLAQLPITVRRVLNEKKLRDQLREAKKALRHSQSLYRALVDNPAYGVCRCDAAGELLDVNQALLTMLGYESKEQLRAGNHKPGIIPSLPNGPPFGTRSPEKKQIEPVELEWKRKDGTTLKVRLSGRASTTITGTLRATK